MIPKLRKKFISITAGALFLMILLVMSAINCIFIFQTNRALDSRLEIIMHEHDTANYKSDAEPWLKDNEIFPYKETTPSTEGLPPGGYPSDNFRNHPIPNETHSPSGLFPKFTDNLRIHADGCMIYLNDDGSIREIHQYAAKEYSKEELQTIASHILQSDETQGWQGYFKFRKTLRTTADGSTETVIGLINASSDLYSICTMLLISSSIGVASFLVVLLIIVFASDKAVKPIAESYTKQKQFVTDAGHELKTPLTVISANNELARMIYGNSEWFDSTDMQIAKMNSLIHNLITLAKMDEEQKPTFTSFNLSDAVYDTAKSFENLIHTSGRLITFDLTEGIFYTGDESKLRQVVSILMDNATKYCDAKGTITVRLNSDRQIKLQVTNDFANASICDLSQVFERFYRADKARTPDGCYGLGLSIAKSIVELHKGEIQAKALPQGRVMFEVILK